MFDLVIKGGTVVTAGSMGICDVAVADGRIAQLGGPVTARREIDASGRYVFPGGVDMHVHFTSMVAPAPGIELRPDDFCNGSQAAIAGGITTIGNMTFQREGESLHAALDRELAVAARDALVDYVLHPVLTYPSPATIAEIPLLASKGHTSLKIFLLFEHFDRHVDEYLQALRAAGRSGVLTMLHCEEGALIRCICRELLAQGLGGARHYPDSRPPFTESASVERAIGFARATGAPIYIVHLSSSAALAACRRARADGVPVYVETRPIYLYLTREMFDRPDGALYVGNPPLRDAADVETIWHGLWSGDIQCLCSDHAPWTRAQKLDPSLNITTFRPGMADLETLMPMLYSEGVHRGRISLSRFVEVTATNTAKLFGLYPQKGTIAVGSDADLVIWDPERRWIINGAAMRSGAGHTVYDGREVHGGPEYTISRGEVVFERGEITAERGRGRWVRRNRTTLL
ncbi:MAG: dihydropyrimidinase [Armatimonadota bacterium]|nr:dihydropyrimidinase [Armatimonadota bacterium]